MRAGCRTKGFCGAVAPRGQSCRVDTQRRKALRERGLGANRKCRVISESSKRQTRACSGQSTKQQATESLWGEAACAALCWTRWEGQEAKARPPLCCLPGLQAAQGSDPSHPPPLPGPLASPLGLSMPLYISLPSLPGIGQDPEGGDGLLREDRQLPSVPTSPRAPQGPPRPLHHRHPAASRLSPPERGVCPYGVHVQIASAAL